MAWTSSDRSDRARIVDEAEYLPYGEWRRGRPHSAPGYDQGFARSYAAASESRRSSS